MTKRILLFIFALFVFPALIHAAATDYLILQDIGPYKIFTTVFPEDFSGPPPKYSQTNTGGILDAADHFSENDVSYCWRRLKRAKCGGGGSAPMFKLAQNKNTSPAPKLKHCASYTI